MILPLLTDKTLSPIIAGLDGRMHRLMQRVGPSPLSKKIIAGLARLSLSNTEIVRLLLLHPINFRCRSVVSNLPYQLRLFGSYEDVLRAVKHGPSLFPFDLESAVKPTVAYLQVCGLGALWYCQTVHQSAMGSWHQTGAPWLPPKVLVRLVSLRCSGMRWKPSCSSLRRRSRPKWTT
jgi:hypothetical protein